MPASRASVLTSQAPPGGICPVSRRSAAGPPLLRPGDPAAVAVAAGLGPSVRPGLRRGDPPRAPVPHPGVPRRRRRRGDFGFDVLLPCPFDPECAGQAWAPVYSITDLHKALTGAMDSDPDIVCTVHGGFDDVNQEKWHELHLMQHTS
jgi:hypothetical protein